MITTHRGEMYKSYYFIFFLFCSFVAVGQSPSNSLLKSLEYEELLTLFNDFDGDSLAQEKIARTYLERARDEGDTVKVARGYDRLARIFHPEKNIQYADSLIEYTKNWEHITYPGLGYIIKGYEFGKLKQINEEYNYYLRAYFFAKEKRNLHQMSNLITRLVVLRANWGDAKNALELQQLKYTLIQSKEYQEKLINYVRKSYVDKINNINHEELIQCYQGFYICNLFIGNYDLAELYIDSLNFVIKNDDKLNVKYRNWVIDASMELDYFFGRIDSVIDKANLLSKRIDTTKNVLHQLKNIYLFKGLSYRKLNKIESSKLFLLKADSIHEVNSALSFRFYDKILFESLIDLFEEGKDFKNQIKYLDKLLRLDSISMVNYRFIEPEIIKKFDTPILLEEKEKAINRLKKENASAKNYLLYGGVLFTILSLFSFYVYRQKVVFKKRFNSLLNQSHSTGQKSKIIISEEIVEGILLKLSEFEENNGFRNPDISLNYLSKKFETNSTYLSKVLNVYKEKNFSQYLNELRVDYAIQEIKDSPNFRKYSIEAIANECGYKNATSFSRAFYKKTGIYPSFFVQQLNKKIT